jgi:hypothetical protein
LAVQLAVLLAVQVAMQISECSNDIQLVFFQAAPAQPQRIKLLGDTLKV